MPDDSVPPFPGIDAYLKQLRAVRAAFDQAQLARLLCPTQQSLQYLPDAATLQTIMQGMQTGVAMLRHLDRQLAWLSPADAPTTRGATAKPAAPVVDANTSASTGREAARRGINCRICKGPVPAPRYRYCGDDCKAEGHRRREVKNSREYRKRKNEEKRKRHEATIARIQRRAAS